MALESRGFAFLLIVVLEFQFFYKLDSLPEVWLGRDLYFIVDKYFFSVT